MFLHFLIDGATLESYADRLSYIRASHTIAKQSAGVNEICQSRLRKIAIQFRSMGSPSITRMANSSFRIGRSFPSAKATERGATSGKLRGAFSTRRWRRLTAANEKSRGTKSTRG